ncbi:hypothetical protein AAHE18_13G237800 [Arachis hypogaea]
MLIITRINYLSTKKITRKCNIMKIQYTFHSFLYLCVQTLLWCQSLEEEAPRPTPEEPEPPPQPRDSRANLELSFMLNNHGKDLGHRRKRIQKELRSNHKKTFIQAFSKI